MTERYEHILGRKGPERARPDKNLDKMSLLENRERMSVAHNITVTIEGNIVSARQINNSILLDKTQREALKKIASDLSTPQFNIPAISVEKLFEGTLANADVVTHPVSIIMISSEGLLNLSEWTSNQPSEGIWVLAEWLSRVEPSAAPVCIDPNMLSGGRMHEMLERYRSPTGLTVLGFSLLPVNLRNDVYSISEIKKVVSKSIVIAGGIGSESLELLPTTEGKRGITEALPVDVVIQGSAVQEIAEIVRGVHNGRIIDKNTLRQFCASISETLHAHLDRESSATLLRDIQKSRETVRTYFIPESRPDIVHDTSYQQANEIRSAGDALRIASVLIDNSCGQNCFFCASPKMPVFSSMEDAANHILKKSVHADIIAFNDNDLSNTPIQTIALCKKMMEKGINQPKHGKIRASEYIPELLDALSQAGFVRIAIGVESFSSRIRSTLGKKDFSTANIEKILDHLLAIGISPEINLIAFSPHESRGTLRENVERALKWVDRGASLYVTLGLFATPNSPGVIHALKDGKDIPRKIDFDTITVPETGKALLFPTQWKVTPEMNEIKKEIIIKRNEILKGLFQAHGVKMPIPIESYVTVALLANQFGTSGYQIHADMMKKIESYTAKHIHTQYVSI